MEIICSLKKRSEEILFSTSWVLQNISPLTPPRRSCAVVTGLFGIIPKAHTRCLGFIRQKEAVGRAEHSLAFIPCVLSSTAYTHPEVADLESAAATALKPFPVHEKLRCLFSYL